MLLKHMWFFKKTSSEEAFYHSELLLLNSINVTLYYCTIQFQKSNFPCILPIDFWSLSLYDESFQNLQSANISLTASHLSHVDNLLTSYVAMVT